MKRNIWNMGLINTIASRYFSTEAFRFGKAVKCFNERKYERTVELLGQMRNIAGFPKNNNEEAWDMLSGIMLGASYYAMHNFTAARQEFAGSYQKYRSVPPLNLGIARWCIREFQWYVKTLEYCGDAGEAVEVNSELQRLLDNNANLKEPKIGFPLSIFVKAALFLYRLKTFLRSKWKHGPF